MKGVLLVNMGGANSRGELKVFLRRMFNDPFILPYGKFGRNLLSYIITNTRYKKSWRKYAAIGGSPIIHATEFTKNLLQLDLGDDYLVKAVFSYSKPFIQDGISLFLEMGITDIVVIPLYPQASFSTTDSVQQDVNDAVAGNPEIRIHFVREFSHHPRFITFWSGLIDYQIKLFHYVNPYLVFSAHSIPEYLVSKGDTYPQAIHESAKAIATQLGFDYEVAFQSGMKRGKWLEPDVKDCLRKLSEKGTDEIIIIPISFVNENLETMYDIRLDLMRFADTLTGIKKITHVSIPAGEDEFIKLLHELVKTHELK